MIYRKGGYASIIQNTGALLFIAPLLIVYAVVQRNFVEGIERTGIIG
jgi:multiple sugar transport system permease protein